MYVYLGWTTQNGLKKAGFEVDIFDKESNYSAELINRYRLSKREILYIVRKT